MYITASLCFTFEKFSGRLNELDYSNLAFRRANKSSFRLKTHRVGLDIPVDEKQKATCNTS